MNKKHFSAPQGFESTSVTVDGIDYEIVDGIVEVPEDCDWLKLMEMGFMPVA